MKSIGLNLILIKPLSNYRDEKVVNVSKSLEVLKLVESFIHEMWWVKLSVSETMEKIL